MGDISGGYFNPAVSRCGVEIGGDVVVCWKKKVEIPRITNACSHLSNEKKHGWLGYIGDEILPRYIGIILIIKPL